MSIVGSAYQISPSVWSDQTLVTIVFIAAKASAYRNRCLFISSEFTPRQGDLKCAHRVPFTPFSGGAQPGHSSPWWS